MKRSKPNKDAPDLINQYLPDNPIMAQAWVDCLRWSVTEPEILAAFRAATGSTFIPGQTSIERMIDQATGRDRDVVAQYIVWFHANVWGEE